MTAHLLQAGAAKRVENALDLTATVGAILDDPAACARMARHAREAGAAEGAVLCRVRQALGPLLDRQLGTIETASRIMRAPDFWKTNGGAAHLLDPIGRLYGLAGRVRRRWVTPKRVGIPVICIGNLTVGGTGKTPTAIAVALQLKARGARRIC